MAKSYFVSKTKSNNKRTWIPTWGPDEDVVGLLKWFIEKASSSAKDITIPLDYMISDSRYVFIYEDTELFKLLSNLFRKKKWQKKIKDIATDLLEIVSDNDEYQQSWNLLMSELLKNGELDFSHFCRELILKTKSESTQYMSENLIERIFISEKDFTDKEECIRATWEFFYIQFALEKLRSSWDRAVVEKCINIIQSLSKIGCYSDPSYENIARMLQALNYEYLVLVAFECIKHNNIQLGKALISDINLSDYLSLRQEMECICIFLALFIDDEKQEAYRKGCHIESSFQTDIKFAYNMTQIEIG